ncbi:hypothetical protein [Bradyrhizobium sp. dw_78]|uniref:hypothetical protein n=1 Tax=Bradyrhizobium sp. dw_78 TaxID=2719793 RepID=UPI001BD3AC4A|nr:hypothetical protein [Bradyrhizobium sp. dw_78]
MKARILGTGREINITLEDAELLKLLSVIASDNDRKDLSKDLPELPRSAEADYYKIPLSWFQERAEANDFVSHYLRFSDQLADFETYFECLCELHKRRRKYSIILSAQPLPTMVQVSPRALLEFGGIPTDVLASWLTWRKWFFDIDNRAGQETGYLFEPILASSLGGTPFPSTRSPIRRLSDTNKGRQVDCIVGKDAYEFKLRVTIAASGQGRFAEEINFAKDCRGSGFRPVLLVLDPTPNPRLSDLKAAFEAAQGIAFIGDAAWDHLENEAGSVMATFVERYVRKPISQLDQFAPTLLDLNASASPDRRTFIFRFGKNGEKHEWLIDRLEKPELATDPEED